MVSVAVIERGSRFMRESLLEGASCVADGFGTRCPRNSQSWSASLRVLYPLKPTNEEVDMPTRKSKTAPKTHEVMKNTAFENIVKGWLMQDGWQVFSPELDHGHQTDVLISDGDSYYRIQVKTVAAGDKEHVVQRMWKDENPIDVVVYFVRNSNWGVVAPAFREKNRPLNHADHHRFRLDSFTEFKKAFHAVPNK